jgi:methyl-accepting chemotaxis protein
LEALRQKATRLKRSGKKLERSGLNQALKDVEAMQEQVRNKRQMASTAFQNFDQKANQQYNLLSSIMKAMNEMRMGTVRNMM